MNMEIIVCQNLCKRYKNVIALEDLTLTFYSGRRYGIVGPNGAGKTTFIKLVCGLLRPTKGVIRVFSLDPWKDRVKILKRISVLHEETLLPHGEKVSKFLMFVGRLKGLSRDVAEKEAKNLLNRFGLRDKINSAIGNLSAGQKRRLELVSTFMGNPELIILDEPTRNVDPSGRREVMSIINELSREMEISFIISSHSLMYIEEICDELVVFNKGKVVASASLKELMAKYFKPAVKIWSNDNLKLLKALKGEPWVIAADLKDDYVTVILEHAKYNRRLIALLHDLNLDVRRIESTRPSLDTVYMKIIGGICDEK